MGGGLMALIAYGEPGVYLTGYPMCPYPWTRFQCLVAYNSMNSLHNRLDQFAHNVKQCRFEKFRSVIRIIGRTQLFKQDLFRTHCYIEI
jgi:hypothetical protein